MRDIQSPTGLHPVATTANAWLHYRSQESPEDLAVLAPRVAQEPEIWIDTETADWNTKSPRLSIVRLRLGDGRRRPRTASPLAGGMEEGMTAVQTDLGPAIRDWIAGRGRPEEGRTPMDQQIAAVG